MTCISSWFLGFLPTSKSACFSKWLFLLMVSLLHWWCDGNQVCQKTQRGSFWQDGDYKDQMETEGQAFVAVPVILEHFKQNYLVEWVSSTENKYSGKSQWYWPRAHSLLENDAETSFLRGDSIFKASTMVVQYGVHTAVLEVPASPSCPQLTESPKRFKDR